MEIFSEKLRHGARMRLKKRRMIIRVLTLLLSANFLGLGTWGYVAAQDRKDAVFELRYDCTERLNGAPPDPGSGVVKAVLAMASSVWSVGRGGNEWQDIRLGDINADGFDDLCGFYGNSYGCALRSSQLAGLGARIPGWVLDEPLHDAWHVLLEGSRDGEIEYPGARVSAVLEVVGDTTRHKDEGALCGVGPFVSDAHAHRAFDDVEDVVFGVRVRTRPLRVGVEPPLRDGVARLSLRPVRLEDCADPTHGVFAAFPWGQNYCLSGCGAVNCGHGTLRRPECYGPGHLTGWRSGAARLWPSPGAAC